MNIVTFDINKNWMLFFTFMTLDGIKDRGKNN